VVIYLEQGADDLRMVQLMSLPPIISCLIKIQNGLPFWCWLSQVVPEKRPLNGCACVYIYYIEQNQQIVFMRGKKGAFCFQNICISSDIQLLTILNACSIDNKMLKLCEMETSIFPSFYLYKKVFTFHLTWKNTTKASGFSCCAQFRTDYNKRLITLIQLHKQINS